MVKNLFSIIKNLFLSEAPIISKENFPLSKQSLEKNLYLKLQALNLKGFDFFWNVYVPYKNKINGEIDHTEVDLIATSKYGIFVFECKDYKGSFSYGYDTKHWSVTYPNGDTYYIYSPFLQNSTHISCLSEHLKINEKKLTPVYIFNCTEFNIKTDNEVVFINILDNIDKLETFIKSHRKTIFSKSKLSKIRNSLWDDMNVSQEVKDKHKERIDNYNN